MQKLRGSQEELPQAHASLRTAFILGTEGLVRIFPFVLFAVQNESSKSEDWRGLWVRLEGHDFRKHSPLMSNETTQEAVRVGEHDSKSHRPCSAHPRSPSYG